jgi:uncharacterized membrane protein YgdD (TMEM256/DUF423 family)
LIRWIVFLAGILGAIGVGIGAHAAHGLEEMLTKQGIVEADVLKRLDQCETAVKYHMLHVVALLALGVSTSRRGVTTKNVAAFFMLLGIALFSGGLYSMVYFGEMGHWAIVPGGGLCLIIGWLSVVNIAFSRDPAKSV